MPNVDSLTDEQLLRYSRQIMLPQIDITGQERLTNAHVVILGLGGLGSPVAMYLAAAGIGKLTLIDDDKVDASNIQRQIIHTDNDHGEYKVNSAKRWVKRNNNDCQVNVHKKRLNENELKNIISSATVIADCSDNFETRFLLNRVCFEQKKPLVSGAAIRWEGQLTTFMMTDVSPCYRCLYDDDSYNDQSCSQNGIVGPVVGIIGSMQALEVIKIISQTGKVSMAELVLLDGLELSFSKIKYKKKSNCPVCGSL